MNKTVLPVVVALSLIGCARLDDTPHRMVSGQLQPVKTWKAANRDHVVMQDYDYSCGAAALATLLNYYFEDPVSERTILRDIVNHLDKAAFDTRKEDGLSLLDLQQYAERQGYQAAGVRLSITELAKLKGPVLVYLEQPDFRHFAVYRGMRENRVFLADPARGNVRQPVDRFVQEWPGIALVLAKPGFGLPQDHDLAVDMEGVFRPEILAARRAIMSAGFTSLRPGAKI